MDAMQGRDPTLALSCEIDVAGGKEASVRRGSGRLAEVVSEFDQVFVDLARQSDPLRGPWWVVLGVGNEWISFPRRVAGC